MGVEKKIIHGVEVTKGDDGKWRDITGAEYALPDAKASKDPVVRLGVGWLSLPTSHPLTPAARAHDAAYSNLHYQQYNPRSRADKEFLRQALVLAGSDFTLRAQAYAFYGMIRALGGLWWESPATRWK